MKAGNMIPIKSFCAGLVLLLASLACGFPTIYETPQPIVATRLETTASSLPTVTPGQMADEIMINASDPCGIFTKEEVQVVFNKSVSVLEPQSRPTTTGSICYYPFFGDTNLKIEFYEEAVAIKYFAILISEAKQGCGDLLETHLFLDSNGPILEEHPLVDKSLLKLPLGELYKQYLDELGKCYYVHREDRLDIGGNIVEVEIIYLSWLSRIAVLSDKRIIQMSYAEEMPPDVFDKIITATDIEDFINIAAPYREKVLVGYAEILIDLLRLATEK